MEKYGVVYIWRDSKHKRYYIGAHWGTENDGYICSSPWMKRAYKLRPNDFKRRILTRVYTNRQEMFDEEAKWQNFIKDEELRIRYYNIRRHGDKHWSSNPNTSLTVREKISKANKGKPSPNKGKNLSEQTKEKISKANKGRNILWADKIGDALRGIPKNYPNPNKKVIYQYDINDNLINQYNSAAEAGKTLNKSGNSIADCAAGRQKTAYGYIWKYKQ